MSNAYPFTTRAQILARLTASPEYAIECVRTLDEERRWMASHKSRAARLVARLAAGDSTAEDVAEAVAIVAPYARTLARLAREREIAARPELMTVAAVFGVARPASASSVPTDAVVVDDTPEVAEALVTPRRRGRPRGAKNKPRPESEQPPKRRRRRS